MDRGHQFGWGGAPGQMAQTSMDGNLKENRLSLSKIGAERRMHGAAARDGRA